MKFLRRIIDAIKNFEKYEDFAMESTVDTIKYILKIIFILVIVVSCVFTYKFYQSTNSAISYFKKSIPELKYENGLLKVDSVEPIIIENEQEMFSVVIIDTNSEENIAKYREKVDLYGNGIIVLQDRVILRSNILKQEIEYKYSDIASIYGIQSFNKQDANVYLTYMNSFTTYMGVFCIIFIYMLVIYISRILVDAIMLGVLALILGRIAGIKISFKSSFNIGIYALTLPIILNLIYIVVRELTDFTISNFNWMYTTISYIYVFIAILMIRTDLINRQRELIKLKEEQQKVRQELEEKEEENKEKDKKENKDSKDEKQKESEDEGNGNLGEQPDGSQA